MLPVSGKVAVPKLGNYQYVWDGDINIAAMLGVHQYSSVNYCSDVTPPDWVIGPEAFIFAVEEINKRDDILPNITLGLVILDDCEKDTTALACATQLVPTEEQLSVCHNQSYNNQSVWLEDQSVSDPGYYKVVGVVGPDYSRSAVMISGLLSLFDIPVLGTFTTSDELSDKARYPYFTRLVSPDVYLTQAILDIADAFDWTYISLVYGEGAYGENAARRVEKLAKGKGICIAVSHRVPSESGESEYNNIAKKLIANKKARTVIVIGETHIIIDLFQAVHTRNMSDYFIWLVGDGFSFFLDEHKDTHIGRVAINAIHIDHPVGQVPGFEDYFRSVTPWTVPKRPWMTSFWENTFDCYWDSMASTVSLNNSQSKCTVYGIMGNYSVTNWYISRYFDGVNVFAEALHNLIKEFCPVAFNGGETIKDCITGNRLLNSIKNVSMKGIADEISFDSNGDMYGSYDIRQVQMENNSLKDTLVGQWSRKEGIVRLDMLQWNLKIETDTKLNKTAPPVPESVCSHPCEPKEHIVYSEVHCCWTCSQCRTNDRLILNGSTCKQCDLYTWPDEDTATSCLPIQPNYMTLNRSDYIGIGLFSMAAFGTILTCLTLVDFSLNRNAKLIKATSRELSTVILLGAQIANILVLIFVLKPTKERCVVREVGFHLATFLMYNPLMWKAIRIFRIFHGGQKGQQKVKFISAKIQLVFVSVSISLQVGAVASYIL